MIEKLLIIPDCHATPYYDNNRFEWLGNFMLHEKPTMVVCLGDFADMPSLSSYDKGKRSFEGRRYINDIEAAVDAQERLFEPFKRAKKGKPPLYMVSGNHEQRIETATNYASELHGAISIEDLQYERFGWNVTPYKSHIEKEGIFFSHNFPSGIMGRPIGGENIGATLCRKLYRSAVVGHSHVFDYAERTQPDGTKIFGLSAGCYSHKDYIDDWCANVTGMWWRGVVVLEGVKNGYYHHSFRAITQKYLEEYYA